MPENSSIRKSSVSPTETISINLTFLKSHFNLCSEAIPLMGAFNEQDVIRQFITEGLERRNLLLKK